MTDKWVTVSLVSVTMALCIMSAAYINETMKVDQLEQQRHTYIEPQIPHSIMLQLIHRHGCAIYLGKVICSKHYLLPRLYRV